MHLLPDGLYSGYSKNSRILSQHLLISTLYSPNYYLILKSNVWDSRYYMNGHCITVCHIEGISFIVQYLTFQTVGKLPLCYA